MTQAKVIISNTDVFVTGYSRNGATIIFREAHGCDSIEHASDTDAVIRAKAAAFNYANQAVIQEDATEDQALSGKFNNRF